MNELDPYSTQTYAYDLDAELVAQQPAARRDESRLLALLGNGEQRHLRFSDLLQLLRPGDLLVANDARVLRARFLPKRRGGGSAQVLLLHPSQTPGTWLAMARPGKRVRPGDRLALSQNEGIEIVDWADGGNRIVRFYGTDAESAMARYGIMPLPPYIRTAPANADERYQTVYAAQAGSVAAPTAGLHFTEKLLAQLRAGRIGWTTITLHVGAGTFRPVREADVRRHLMHAEYYDIGVETAEVIGRTRASGGRIVAIGTTTLRALEDSARQSKSGNVEPGSRWTSLFIHPPDAVHATDALVTNFHLPRSTLLMLVCAFGGTQRVLDAYRKAAAMRYRFYSFGDAMFLEPLQEPI